MALKPYYQLKGLSYPGLSIHFLITDAAGLMAEEKSFFRVLMWFSNAGPPTVHSVLNNLCIAFEADFLKLFFTLWTNVYHLLTTYLNK